MCVWVFAWQLTQKRVSRVCEKLGPLRLNTIICKSLIFAFEANCVTSPNSTFFADISVLHLEKSSNIWQEFGKKRKKALCNLPKNPFLHGTSETREFQVPDLSVSYVINLKISGWWKFWCVLWWIFLWPNCHQIRIAFKIMGAECFYDVIGSIRIFNFVHSGKFFPEITKPFKKSE